MNQGKPKTPAEQLAGRIISRLTKEGIISEGQGKNLLPRLASGNLKAEDWRLAIELSFPGKGDDSSQEADDQ